MKQVPLFALLICSSAWLSCTTSIVSGQSSRENRTVNSFKGVSLSMSADVYLTQGPQSVTVEADANDMKEIVTEISGNKLEIKNRPGHWKNISHVKVYVSTPEIEEINVSGSGSVIVEQSLKTGDLTLHVSGSGDIRIRELQSGRISSTITGSGNIELSGRNEQSILDVTITGSGSFKAEELPVGNAKVSITGSGSARIHALKELDTEISGSGNVLYKGNPQVEARSSGSGRTSHLN